MSPSTVGGAPIWLLFQTVSSSIVQLILVSISGYVLTLLGILDKATQRQLNVINMNFFMPCLLFSEVAFSLSSDKLQELWIIPVFFILISGVSLVIAWLLGFLFGLNPRQRNFAMGAAMIMNSNSLPVALLQALAVSVPGLKWGQDDTVDSITERALTYLLLGGTVGQFIRWSYGVQLLSKSVPPDDIEYTTVLDDETNSLTDGIEDTESVWREGRHGEPVLDHSRHNENNGLPVPVLQPSPDTTYMQTIPQCSDAGDAPIPNSDGGSEQEDVPVPAWTLPAPIFVQRVIRAGGTIWKRTTVFMTPPLWASVISVAIALNQPIQHLFDGFLRPVRGGINQVGDCAIPISLVVLGAHFHTPADGSAQPSSDAPVDWQRASVSNRLREIFCPHSESQKGAIRLESHGTRLGNRGEGKTIVVAILARMFIAPLLLLPFVVLGALRGSPVVFQDPVFILSMVLLLASPPAFTLAQFTQVTSDAYERLVGRTIFWSYCVVAPPVTVGYALIAMLITRL